MFSQNNCVALVRSSLLEAAPLARSCNFFGNRRDDVMNGGLERGIEERTWWMEDGREEDSSAESKALGGESPSVATMVGCQCGYVP